MLTKKEITNLICDHIWTLRIPTDRQQFFHLVLGNYGINGALTVIFRRDGTIDFPTNIAFKPAEFRGWDFDELKQESIFFDDNYQESKRATAPIQWAGKSLKVDLIGESNVFTYEPHVEKKIVEEQTIGGVNLFFIPRNAYSFKKFQSLAHTGFTIKRINPTDSVLSFLSVAYDYIIIHPKLKKIVISQIDQVFTPTISHGKLLLANADEEPSFTYITGTREIIIELLTTILSENNKRLLNSEDYRSEEDLLQEILITRFNNRYALLDLPIKQ